MQHLIVWLGLAAVGAAQTSPSPVIVKGVVFEDQTQLVGSLSSPVALFTPSVDGFYRMTMYISGTQTVNVCGVFAPNKSTLCAASGDFGDSSVVVSFPGRSGQSIGYFTAVPSGTLNGRYYLDIAIERLF